MPTRISFSTTWPDRMGDLAGKPTYFTEKIWSGLTFRSQKERSVLYNHYKSINNWDNEYPSILFSYNSKTTTIRSNYKYWKSKEGQMIQPFFWAGKPHKSKQVCFCPPVLLKEVEFIRVLHMEGLNVFTGDKKGEEMPYFIDDNNFPDCQYGVEDMVKLAKSEGFDSPDHFFRWFNKDFDGALLKFG